jgi:hypothetical protein
LADLYSAHRNQTEKSEIQKIIPLGAWNGGWKMQCSSIYWHRRKDEKHSLQRRFEIIGISASRK